MSEPLQGRASFTQKIDTPEFWALDTSEKKYVLDNLTPEFSGLDDSEKDFVIQGLQQTPSVNQGIGNLAGSVTKGIGDFVQSLPQAIPQMAQQAGQAIGTQAKSFLEGSFQGRDPLLDAQVSATAGGYNAIKGLVEGAYNLPGSIQNAYMGRNQVPTTQFIPQANKLPFVGQAIGEAQQRNPVAGFIGEQVPFALPFASAARARFLPSIAEGAGLGLIQQPEGNNQLSSRLQGAAMGGALPTGFGAAARVFSGRGLRAPKQQGPKVKGLGQMQAVGIRQNGRLLTEQGQGVQQFREAAQRKINEAGQRQSVTESKTQAAKIAALKKQYENLSQAANNPKTQPKIRQNADVIRGKVLEVYNNLAADYEAKYGKPKAQGKEPLESLTKPEDVNALVGLVKEMRSKGNAKQADVAMGRFTRETKAKVYDEVKRQESTEKARLKQAQTDNKALNKGEQANQKRETKQLQGDIAQRAKQDIQQRSKEASDIQKREAQLAQEQKAKAVHPKERKPKPVAEPRMTGEQIRAEVKKAEKSGESITLRYRAEKYGETGQYEYKTVHSPKLDISKDGKVMVRGINDEGQVRTYLERDSSGSEILSVQRNKTPSRYKEEMNPDSGKREIRDIESGDTIEQIKKEGIKSSKIRSELDKMRSLIEAADNGKKPTVQQVMDAARSLSVKDLETNPMPAKARKELYKKTTGDPC